MWKIFLNLSLREIIGIREKSYDFISVSFCVYLFLDCLSNFSDMSCNKYLMSIDSQGETFILKKVEMVWLALTFIETFLGIFIASIRAVEFTIAGITNRNTFTVPTLKLTLRTFLLELLLPLLKHWKQTKRA